MKTRIEWVCENTRLLGAIAEEFRQSRPFAGKTIGTGIHLEPKTVSLLLTLQSGGARVVSTGNLNTTQQEAVEYLKASGLTVIGDATRDLNEHQGFLAAVLAEKPDILLDNGGDLFDLFRRHRYPGLMGAPRRRPPGACGSSRCAKSCGCRSSSSTTARSSSSPRTNTRSDRACWNPISGSPIASRTASA